MTLCMYYILYDNMCVLLLLWYKEQDPRLKLEKRKDFKASSNLFHPREKPKREPFRA